MDKVKVFKVELEVFQQKTQIDFVTTKHISWAVHMIKVYADAHKIRYTSIKVTLFKNKAEEQLNRVRLYNNNGKFLWEFPYIKDKTIIRGYQDVDTLFPI